MSEQDQATELANTKRPPLTLDRRNIVIFGEAMIELSDLREGHAKLGVAGDTFNTSVYLARAGQSVSYVSAIGKDHFSRMIERALRDEDISTHLLTIHQTRNAGLYAIETDARGERSFTYWRSQSAARGFFQTEQADRIAADIKNASIFYLSGITLSLYTPEEQRRLHDIAEAVRVGGGHVVFDTNYRARNWSSPQAAREAISAFAPLVNIALPTFEDEQTLFGDESPRACADRWKRLGAEEVVVKDGENGAYVSSLGWVPPPIAIRPVDTTGAGDSFNAAYLSARIEKQPPLLAVRAAHNLAGRVLETHGAILPKSQSEFV